MPTIRTPSGRKLRVPDDATPEQIAAVLQSIGEMPQEPAPAPAPAPAAAPPPPAAPAPSGGPVGGPPATTTATPPPTPPPSAPVAPQIGGSLDPTEGMSGADRFIAGMGQSVDSNIRGARQLFNYLTGDEKELAQLKEQENEARRLDAPLLNTGAGRGGQIGGHILQALLPAGAAGKAATGLGGGLLATAGAEAGAGALMGAVQPTTGDESRLQNTLVSGAIGGVLPVGAKIASLPTAAKVGLARMLTPRGAGAVGEMVGRLGGNAGKVSQQAGKQISKLVDDVRVPIGKELASKLRGVSRDYGKSLPPVARDRLARLIEMAENPSVTHLKGSAAQTVRSDFGKEAAASEGFRQSGLNKAKRIMDEAIEGSMPKAKARALRAAREQYRTGVKPVSATSPTRAGTRGLAQALRAGAMPVYEDDETLR